jgi:tripartite-type tricarboxylate transporter receptor subunit TctC
VVSDRLGKSPKKRTDRENGGDKNVRLHRYANLLGVGLATVLAAFTAAARAADYPSRPVHLIVAFSAGGPTDFVARLLADKLKGLLGQSVLVENKPGANAAIGADYVARAEPDGYTLFLTTSGAVAINPHLRADLPYDPIRDFAPISRVIITREILVVGAAAPVKTVAELVALAKAKPGEVALASTGVGSPPHLAMELLQQGAGVKMLHVPYRGAAPAITDILGGQVMGAFLDLPVVKPQIVAGTLRALGTASAKRDEVLPDVPTLEEQGVHGVNADNWYALLAPAKTPAPVVAKLNAAVHAALDDAAVHAALIQNGAIPAATSPEELAGIMKSELARWGKIIKERGIKIN